jgi:predicted lipoprotein
MSKNIKHGIELNGVANIQLLMQLEVDKADDAETGGTIYYMNEETYKSIMEQLKYLQSYMIEYCKAVNANVKEPYWHEIREKNK